MNMHYQSHRQQANSQVQARLQEAEIHRLAKQGGQKHGFSLIGIIKGLFGRREASEFKGQTSNVLRVRRQRYAE